MKFMKPSVVGGEPGSRSISSEANPVRNSVGDAPATHTAAPPNNSSLPQPAVRRRPTAPAAKDKGQNFLELVANADFSGVDWQGRHLSRVVFENVSFQGADLRGAVFENVIFRRCNLQGACLDGAQLRRVCGVYILAEGASLRGVQADNTQWIGCFREADFTGSVWHNSGFYSSDMRNVVGVQGFRHGKLRTVPLPDRDKLVAGLQKEVSRGEPGMSPASASLPAHSSPPVRSGDFPPGDFPPFRNLGHTR